jgi:hypothetical protein
MTIQAMDEGRVSTSATSVPVDADADEREAALETPFNRFALQGFWLGFSASTPWKCMVKILCRVENKRGTGLRWLGGENLGRRVAKKKHVSVGGEASLLHIAESLRSLAYVFFLGHPSPHSFTIKFATRTTARWT